MDFSTVPPKAADQNCANADGSSASTLTAPSVTFRELAESITHVRPAGPRRSGPAPAATTAESLVRQGHHH